MIPNQPSLGAHTFIWAPAWTKHTAEHIASRVADARLSIVEIPLLDPTQIDVASTVAALRQHDLTATCSLGLPRHAHAPDEPDAAIEFLRVAIATASAIGSSWLTGALYGHLGTLTGCAPTSTELDTVAQVIQVAADHAEQRGVRLGMEIINRYETYILNTAEQMLDLARMASLIVRQARKGARVMIELAEPFGEHCAENRDSMTAVSFVALRIAAPPPPTAAYLEHYRRGFSEHAIDAAYARAVLALGEGER